MNVNSILEKLELHDSLIYDYRKNILTDVKINKLNKKTKGSIIFAGFVFLIGTFLNGLASDVVVTMSILILSGAFFNYGKTTAIHDEDVFKYILNFVIGAGMFSFLYFLIIFSFIIISSMLFDVSIFKIMTSPTVALIPFFASLFFFFKMSKPSMKKEEVKESIYLKNQKKVFEKLEKIEVELTKEINSIEKAEYLLSKDEVRYLGYSTNYFIENIIDEILEEKNIDSLEEYKLKKLEKEVNQEEEAELIIENV